MPLEELDDTGLKVPKPSQVFFPLPRAFVFLAVLLSVSQHAASLGTFAARVWTLLSLHKGAFYLTRLQESGVE